MSRPTTLLGKHLAAGADKAPAASSVSAPATAPTKLAQRAAVGGRRGREVDVPGLGRAWIELVGAVRYSELVAAAQQRTRELGYNPKEDELAHAIELEFQIAIRVLPLAVRDPDDHAAPFGSPAEWGELDGQLVTAAWHAYGDVRAELDPMAEPLTEDEALAIAVAVKKKDVSLLRAYGTAKLSLWLATTGGPPSTSQTPSSPSSESPSASST